MNPILLIPARMASTRLPNKPLADIAGRPMIVHVWKRAVQAGIGEVVVACDDARVKRAIEDAGGKAVMTREDHPSGSDRIYEALQQLDPQKKYDVVINVQGDVPTIDPEAIRAVLLPLANPEVDIATLAAIITDENERTDPAVVKPVFASPQTLPPLAGGLEGGAGQRVVPCFQATLPRPPASGRGFTDEIAQALSFTRTPENPQGPLYHHIGIYAYRRAALERFISLPPSPLELRDKLEQLRAIEAGMRIDVAIVATVPLGVDTAEHLEKARNFLTKCQSLK